MGCLESVPRVPSQPNRPPVQFDAIPLPESPGHRSRVQLHVPIYVALQSHRAIKLDWLSFEKEDEMKLIDESHAKQLRVYHLRTSLTGLVLRTFVALDATTPLRLAVTDRGIINRCLIQYNRLGSYLIRCSRQSPMDFVLSIAQINEDRNTAHWHYLICTDPSTQRFYFCDEAKLRQIFFTSFRQLVADARVLELIPLGDILPHAVDFDEELWNIPIGELTIGEKIGEGAFGVVFRADWHRAGTSRPVAVKKIRMHSVTAAVTREIEAMKTLTNLYIVSLYGVSSDRVSNEIYLVTEFLENGDLKTWLVNLPELPSYATLVRFAKHIAFGMTYLEERCYVHRDLACRNILVGSNATIVKIADFGLSTIVNERDAERRQEAHSQKLPFRWLAPEVIEDKASYSIKSDVWSFGILLIEIWLKGGNPYDDKCAPYVTSTVLDGFVHDKPPDCPEAFYRAVICRCLEFRAADRPSFDALRQLLDQWQL